MAKMIPLSRGLMVIVDDKDYSWLSQWKWSAVFCGADRRRCYAQRVEQGKTIRMHRLVLGLTDPKIQCDHKNGNGLDNRRENLRAATGQQNSRNQHKPGQYKGTSLDKRDGRWSAYIRSGGKRISLGRFSNQEDAARAYDEAAFEHYGEFACLNFPVSSPA